MHVTVGELIGNFILIAGSFILLLVLIKKFAWSNITGIFEEELKKLLQILIELKKHVKSGSIGSKTRR